jgi:hypothetical protein
MKKIVGILLTVILLVPCMCAFSESIDLSGLCIEELAILRDRCQMEMMKSDKWQEVRVPVGVWEVGKDIPAGHWSITCALDTAYMGWGTVTYCDKLKASGKDADRWGSDIYYQSQVRNPESNASVEATTIDIEAVDGTFIIIEYGAMIFTPYSGKPDLGFK